MREVPQEVPEAGMSLPGCTCPPCKANATCGGGLPYQDLRMLASGTFIEHVLACVPCPAPGSGFMTLHDACCRTEDMHSQEETLGLGFQHLTFPFHSQSEDQSES